MRSQMAKGRSLSPEYSRYINSPGWKKSFRRWLALHLLFGGDAVIPFLRAHHVEHLSYKRIDFHNCRGYEIPFLDLLPLNRWMHLEVVTPLKDQLRRSLGRCGQDPDRENLRYFEYGRLLQSVDD